MTPSLLEVITGGQEWHSIRSTLTPRAETPTTIEPLPDDHRRGLIAVGVTSLLSTVTTTILLFILTYRLVFWRKYFRSYIGYNQYIILIYNLLLADLQEALGFLISLHWVDRNAVTIHTPVCFAQGFLLQIGDPSSGLWVLAIAVHTFVTILLGRKIRHKTFVAWIIGLWSFCLLLVVVPLAMYKSNTFAPTGPWCWIDERHDATRLWAHYFWIFLSEFGSLVLYAILFIYLRRQVSASAALGPGQNEHLRRLRRVTGYMVLYPLAYTVLSLPLAAGRMTLASGTRLNISYMCAAGALIASSGWVDVIMYALTRRALLTDSQPSLNDGSYSHRAQQRSHVATITTDNRFGHKPNTRRSNGYASPADGDSSTENIVKDVELAQMGKVYQQTTIEVTHERAGDQGTYLSNSESDEDQPQPHRDLWFGK